MKTLFVWFAAATLGAAVSWTPAMSAELKAQPTQKFALLMSHMDNEFTIQMSGAVKDKAKELGANLTVFDARNEIAKQINQVETAVTQGYTGIMIEPVAVDGLGPALAAAKKAGLIVINVNQRVSDPKVTDAYVGANPVEGGEIEMGFIAKQIGKGNVALLLGPLGSDAQIGRTQGYENVLKNFPDIKVVYKQTANWRTDEALKLTENWLQTGADLAAIVSNNDDMALGAVKAVKDAHLVGKIKIAGIDAAPNALAAVKDGSMTATVSQNTIDQGRMAMEAAVKAANGEKIQPTITVPHALITKENVGQFGK
jgi:ribose transport system substrate-binding protein/inositol transport system substrate-binding protein